MTVRELREASGLSQSRFAELMHVPVRTLQQWEQGKREPAPYINWLIERAAKVEFANKLGIDVNAVRIPNKENWKTCIEHPFYNCSKIYPIQQKKVRQIIDEIENNNSVSRVIIFGSSVTSCCHIGSDVDVYMDMTEDYNPISRITSFEYDFWNNFRADSRLLNEIKDKGVVVYGQSR